MSEKNIIAQAIINNLHHNTWIHCSVSRSRSLWRHQLSWKRYMCMNLSRRSEQYLFLLRAKWIEYGGKKRTLEVQVVWATKDIRTSVYTLAALFSTTTKKENTWLQNETVDYYFKHMKLKFSKKRKKCRHCVIHLHGIDVWHTHYFLCLDACVCEWMSVLNVNSKQPVIDPVTVVARIIIRKEVLFSVFVFFSFFFLLFCEEKESEW